MADFPHTAHSSPIAIIPARAFDDTRLSAAPLKLLGVLGTYANRNGWCWPSITTLAKRMGVNSRQAIQKHLAVLCELSYLKVQHQVGGVNRYRILYDVDLPTDCDRMAEEEPANSTLAPPCQPVVAPRQREVGTPRQREVGIEPTIEPKKQDSPSFKVSKETKTAPAQGSKRKRGESWPEDFELTPAMAKYARDHTPNVDAQADFDRFRCNAKAKGLKYVDWLMAWYTWCRSPYGKPMLNGANPYHQPQKKRPQLLDRLAAADEPSSNPNEWSN